ncbi:hypothetical protein AeMF1_018782 [Aphanomyces euteiches]|nr:hypothetical protein AeMF1_018782 [Aphanomyces euteiches]
MVNTTAFIPTASPMAFKSLFFKWPSASPMTFKSLLFKWPSASPNTVLASLYNGVNAAPVDGRVADGLAVLNVEALDSDQVAVVRPAVRDELSTVTCLVESISKLEPGP